jgi:hypothetical protein
MDSRLVTLGSKIVQVPYNLPRSRALMQDTNPLVAFLESGFDGCKFNRCYLGHLTKNLPLVTEEFRLPLFEFRYTRGRTFQNPYSSSVWSVPDELFVSANPSIEVTEENRVQETVFQYLEQKKKKKGKDPLKS